MRSTKFGGLERYFVEMAKVLSTRGDILYIQYNEEPYSNDYIAALRNLGVRIIISNLNTTGTFKNFIELHKIIKDTKPNIIHFHFGKAATTYMFLPKLMGVKKVYKSIHSLPFSTNRISIFSKIRFKLLAIFNNNIVAVSKAIKRQVEAAIGQKGKVIVHYTGTLINETPKDNPKGECERIKMSCVAFHNKVKGIDVLLHALHTLKFKHKFVMFDLIQIGGGNDEYKKDLEELVCKLHLKENVNFFGFSDNVPELLSCMDIYIQPSRSEGIGLALMEAAIQGNALIGSNVGGIPEIITDNKNGLLFEVENSDELAEKLYKLCTNKELRQKLGINAKDVIKEKFDVIKNVKRLINELY